MNAIFHENYVNKLRKKRGQTLVEYTLVLAFLALVSISVLYATGSQVTGLFSKANSQIASATGVAVVPPPPARGGG